MKSPRILIVEDEAITVAALKRELTSFGYEVVGTADTVEGAVKATEQYEPDLVLMDITLAGELDGIIAALVIRGSAPVPVVFLSAHSDGATIRRAMLSGAFGYLIKPFTGADLKGAIVLALSKHRQELEQRQGT